MSKKSQQAADLFKKIERTRPIPSPAEDGPLIEQGMLCVLLRHMPQDKATAALDLLRKAYPDWNELRVSQVQEVVRHLRPRSKALSPAAILELRPAAIDAREYLQDVYQKTHGLDLEYLREDETAAAKAVSQLTFLGVSSGTYLLWLASNRDIPVHGAVVRVLDRLGLMSRTGSVKKAREQLVPVLPAGKELEFTTAFGEIADRWCDSRKPACWDCVLVGDCAFGKKVFKEWKAQQVRHEQQRKREEARRLEQERKDRVRRERDEARELKRREAEEKKLERERQRKERDDAKRKDAEAKKRKQAEEQKRKKEAASRAATAKKKAPAKKKAKTTKKKATASGAGKSAPKKKTTAKKTSSGKTPTRKKAAAKPTTRKKTTQRKTRRKR